MPDYGNYLNDIKWRLFTMYPDSNLQIHTENENVCSILPVCHVNVLRTGYITKFNKWNNVNVCEYFWHLYCNPDSEASGIRCNGMDYPLSGDACMLIPPFTQYSTYNNGPINHLFVHFTLDENFFFMHRRPYIIRQNAVLLKELCNALASGQVGQRISWLSTAMVLSAFTNLPEAELKKAVPNDMDHRIQRSLEIYMEQPMEMIDNAYVATKIGMSKPNFERLFKNQTGMSARAFQRTRQMQMCADALRFTNASIKEISQEAGYSDRYNFSRIFKKFYGIGPAAYRKQALFP